MCACALSRRDFDFNLCELNQLNKNTSAKTRIGTKEHKHQSNKGTEEQEHINKTNKGAKTQS